MGRVSSAFVAALGLAALAGGICATFYAIHFNISTTVTGLGPFNGVWSPADYCFLGGVLVTAGVGLAAFGILARRRSE